ncbi:MAG: formyltransferase family protein [Cyclobacteriaceae bacterium]
MKIALFLNKDIESNITYNLLKKELLNHEVKIYYSGAVGNPKKKPFELLRLERFEKEFFFNGLIDFIQENRIETDFEFLDQNFKSFTIEECANVNSTEFIANMNEFCPDLFISIRFGKIFKDDVIKVPGRGLINLHSAILPDYRGIMGTLHAIKERNNKIGCTLHTIPNGGIDTGEIIEIAKCNADYERSLFWNIIQLYPLGANLIIKALKNLEQNINVKTIKQNPEEGRYFSVPNQSDFDQIKNLGMNVISEKDYQQVITDFVLKDLSEKEKRHLTLCLSNSGLS